MFPRQNPVCNTPLPHTCFMPCPSQSSWFKHPNCIWWRVQSIKYFVIQSLPIPFRLVLLRPKYHSQHPIYENHQPTFPLIVSDQISHPYKRKGKIIIFYIYSCSIKAWNFFIRQSKCYLLKIGFTRRCYSVFRCKGLFHAQLHEISKWTIW
jgi:hypothetical protein